MSVTFPANGAQPVLDLALPVFTDATVVRLTNNTIGKALTLELPAWDGDDLTLDFVARTITDQTGADRSDLLGLNSDLWIPQPLEVGANDVEIEVVDLADLVSSGPLSPGTLADNAGTGAIAWTNPGNAGSSNNVYASCNLGTGGPSNLSHYLKATNFGFAVPANASIIGITAEVERATGGGTFPAGSPFDNSVKIVKGGTILGVEHAAAGVLPPADAYKTYGGTTDLWGSTWTPGDINASTFGLVFSVGSAAGSVAGVINVDHIRAIVHYVVPEAYGATAAWAWKVAYA